MILTAVLETLIASGILLRNDGLLCVGLIAVIVFLATSTRRSARRCPRCHEVNREAAVYCAQCGTQLRKS